jgi:hypothetical protein
MIMMDFDDVTAGRINLPVLVDDLTEQEKIELEEAGDGLK